MVAKFLVTTGEDFTPVLKIDDYLDIFSKILLGLGKGSASVMSAYLFLKVIDLTHGHQWGMLLTPMGLWYLVEVAGFTLIGPVEPWQPPRLFTPMTKKRRVSSGLPGPTMLSHQPTSSGRSA